MSTDRLESVYGAIGLRIRARREAACLTQQEMADRLGISRLRYADYEHAAARISLHRLEGVCRVFGCHLADLLTNPTATGDEPT